MNNLGQLRSLLIPDHYKNELIENVPDDWLILAKGAYMFAAVPFSTVISTDYNSNSVRKIIKTTAFTFPIIAEKGLFLLYYGDEEIWLPQYDKFKVDKTGLRPVILQSVHFADFSTGSNFNTRTSWGPVKFGFCGKVVELLQSYCAEISAKKT